MKIKLDENLSRHLKPQIEGLGHDVHTAADEHLLGQDDTTIAAAAQREGRMLFTLDTDFADARRFPPGSHEGIVVFRPASLGPLAVNKLIIDFAASGSLPDIVGCLVVVEIGRVRVRRSDATET